MRSLAAKRKRIVAFPVTPGDDLVQQNNAKADAFSSMYRRRIMKPKKPSKDDPASAPESGTERDNTTGNQLADPENRPASGQTGKPSNGNEPTEENANES
jgi:hypothetical protein